MYLYTWHVNNNISMHWPLHKNFELLKIFKVIDVPLFKQGFNLEINNVSVILVSRPYRLITFI